MMAKAKADITAQQVKECAMLILTRQEAAIRLGISEQEFTAALDDPALARAWDDGRRDVRESVHGALIEQAKAGNVNAAKFVDHLLDRQGAASAQLDIKVDPVVPPEKSGHPPLKLATTDDIFREEMRKRKGKAG